MEHFLRAIAVMRSREDKGSKFVKTQCQDEFRNLSGCVIKILTAGRILQISIARCQIEAEIHSFGRFSQEVNRKSVKLAV